jgi:hypothetical protein
VQQQPRGGFRRFLQSSAGKALLIAATILLVFASFVYVQTLIAIPVFLLFGLAVPIWAGLKAPKFLALSGLVVILLVAPIANAAITQEIMTPLPDATSSTGLPFSSGSSPVLQNAAVTPYVGGTSTNFTWQVTVYPQYLPYPNSTLQWITLYISSCPGATGNSSPNCSPGYSLWALNDSLNGTTTTTTVTFHYTIGSQGIWDWQMELAYVNGTKGNLTYQLLVGDATYNGLEGPVVGTFSTVFVSLLPTLYLDVLLFLGLPFYVVLLLYMVFKSRERRKQDAQRRAAGPTPSDEAGSAPGSSGSLPPTGVVPAVPTSAAPVSTEGACPNCGAVVYANETTCWKCGAAIKAPPTGSAPLPSSGPR